MALTPSHNAEGCSFPLKSEQLLHERFVTKPFHEPPRLPAVNDHILNGYVRPTDDNRLLLGTSVDNLGSYEMRGPDFGVSELEPHPDALPFLKEHLVLVPDIFDKDKKQVSLMYDPMRRIYEDMPALKYKVELNETARTHLKQIASRGEASARKVKRALVLLKADEGLPDRDIASGLLISASTVGRVRTRFVKEGLDSALNERPRPGQKRKLDGRQEAHLIAVACSDAPEGHADWTLQLLADKVVAMGFAESISLETVRQMLKKTSSSRGRRRSGVSRR